MSNTTEQPQDSYPVASKARQEVLDAGIPADEHPYGAMLDALHEYEHGSADVLDVAQVTLEQYAAIVVDLCLTIHFYQQP